MQIRAYMVAVDGVEHEAIRNAAKAFMQGKVKREDNRFAPSCAEFADRCRDEANMIAAQRRPKIEPPAREKPSSPPVAPWKMKLFIKASKGDEQAQQKLREIGVWK
ncbi:hypothetical protein ABCW43_00200 [Neorhizobium sp. IRAMC:178]|uniref:hypothetical protein n=1 Tax=Neorhizobium tunisiense TaxID=3144793 RepID=UPI0031F6E50C